MFYVASNADPTLPTPRGEQPGNGSLVQVLVTATGFKPVVAGKPEPPLHAESVERVGAKRPLVVGDRLDTDIEGAFRGGADSLLVLTGVTKPAELLLAVPGPASYVARDLTGLNASHPGVTVSGDKASCGGWTASPGGDWLTVSGSGDWTDGLRALSAAAWAAGLPPGSPPEQRKAAEAVLGGHRLGG